VLKYPHIAMTGPAQRGYVATMSSPQSSDYEAWKSFDNNSSTWSEHAYNSVAYAASGATNGNQATTNNIDGSGTYEGEWIQIQFPQKVIISRYELTNRNNVGNRMPKTAKLLGSNDGSNWTTVYNHSDLGGAYTSSGQETRNFDVSSSTGYKYFRLITNELFPGVSFDTPNIATWKLYGTEEDLDIVARVGEGLDGKVANFRVYDKYLHEEQALELWDAQKDQFGRATSSVSVYRGHVGIGTTTPEAALTVMDEAHESEEFPPRGMTADETYMEGHGLFRTFSPKGTVFNSLYGAWEAFDKNVNNFWSNDGNEYATDGTYNGGDNTGIINFNGNGTFPDGPWVGIEMPYKTKIESFVITSRANSQHVDEFPRKFSFYGTNGDDTWKLLKIFDNVSSPGYGSTTSPFYVYSDTYYRKYVFIWEEIQGGESEQEVTLSNISLFGTRERGQSTLHDGSLTLTKNLTVPRIGPPLDADDTPRRDRLVVEYNTSTNPTENGTVRDTSGRGNDSEFYSYASYNATEKALEVPNTTGIIRKNTNLPSGNTPLSVSAWFKCNLLNTTNNDTIVCLGTNSTATGGGSFILRVNSDQIRINFEQSSNYTEFTKTMSSHNWYHAVATYDGGTSASGRKLFIDGVEIAQTSTNGTITGVNLPANPDFAVGMRTDISGYLDGYISNFKLYDVALTATDVKRLYDMGRLGNVIAQPVHIAAPLYAPGVPVQFVSAQVHDKVAYSAAESRYVSPLDISITPHFSNSKIYLMWRIEYEAHQDVNFRIYRDSTLIGYNTVSGDVQWSGVTTSPYDQNVDTTPTQAMITWIDEPNTTSTVTYKVYVNRSGDNNREFYLNRTVDSSGANNRETGVSQKTAMEIAQ